MGQITVFSGPVRRGFFEMLEASPKELFHSSRTG